MDIRMSDGRHVTKYSAFAIMHPWTNFIYIALVLVITMFTMNPVILAVSYVGSLALGIYLQGSSFIKKNIMITIPVVIFSVVIQPVFNHSGVTPVFYINDNMVCLENIIYGAVISLLLISVIQWCSVAASYLSSEKMMYLFGSFIPSVGMIFSMILRMIPLMRKRYRQIHDAQMGLRGVETKNGIFEKIGHFANEFSTLITWSLESSMETSMSMESRGYGLKGRTSFNRFRFTLKDTFTIIIMLVCFVMAVIPIAGKKLAVYYLPVIYFTKSGVEGVLAVAAFAILTVIPMIIEITGNVQYKRRSSYNER